VLDLIVELARFILEIIDLNFVQHDDFVISVITQEALKTNGAKAVLAEGLDVLLPVYLAL